MGRQLVATWTVSYELEPRPRRRPADVDQQQLSLSKLEQAPQQLEQFSCPEAVHEDQHSQSFQLILPPASLI
jgi:hypothetical protein